MARSPPCGDYGDVNGDGIVDDKDISLINGYIAGTITLTSDQLIRADVNRDEKVDGADKLYVEKYVANTIDTFPVCSIRHIVEFVSVPAGATIIFDGSII